MENKTLLVIVPGNNVDYETVFYLVVAETGEVLASHLCSNSFFAPGDLYFNRKYRIEEFSKRFGEVEVKFINETDVSEDVLLFKNHSWYESVKNEEL